MGGWAHQLQADLKTQLGSLLKRERVERANLTHVLESAFESR